MFNNLNRSRLDLMIHWAALPRTPLLWSNTRSDGNRFQMVLTWEQISDGAQMGADFRWCSHGFQEEIQHSSPPPMTRDRASASPCSKICFYFDINRISSVLEKDSAESKGPRGEENVIHPFIEDVIGFL